MEVIRRHLLAQAIVLPHRGEEVRTFVIAQNQSDRLLEVRPARIAQGPDGSRGVGDVGVAEQHQGVQPLLLHDRLHALHALPLHPGEVRHCGNTRRWGLGHQPCGHQSATPRYRFMLSLTMAVAASTPTASTTDFSDSLL